MSCRLHIMEIFSISLPKNFASDEKKGEKISALIWEFPDFPSSFQFFFQLLQFDAETRNFFQLFHSSLLFVSTFFFTHWQRHRLLWLPLRQPVYVVVFIIAIEIFVLDVCCHCHTFSASCSNGRLDLSLSSNNDVKPRREIIELWVKFIKFIDITIINSHILVHSATLTLTFSSFLGRFEHHR